MIRAEIRIALLLVVFVATTTCRSRRNDGLREGRSPTLPSELVIVEGAQKIRSGGNRSFARLTYELTTPYPAAVVISTISRHLSAEGYRPLKNNWFNRDDTSEYERGWVQYIGVPAPKAKGQFICRWWAQWRNAKGEIVDYSLTYTSPDEVFTNHNTLAVSASKMNAGIAEQLRAGVTSTEPPIELSPQTPPNAATATDNSPDPHVYVLRPPAASNST